MSDVLALVGGMLWGFVAACVIRLIKDNASDTYMRGYKDGVRDGINEVMNDFSKLLGGRMHSYNDTKVGDRVRILGTVTDISESGVQTIRPDTDSEGYVRARKIEGKEDDHD